MANMHSKSTVWILNGNDLSTFMDSSDWDRTPDMHDVTTYGKDDHVSNRGLGNGGTPLEGWYDNTVSGPRAVIAPLEKSGTTVTLIHRPEGTGSGRPQDSVPVIVASYKETKPVANYVRWAATLQHNGAVTSTTQA